MGAYGGTVEASKPPPNWHSIIDLTNDNKVDAYDLQLFAQHWLGNELYLSADLNRNQLVDLADFAIFADNWLWP
jgi:NADH:ubiquinone oxidoreductase subunit